MYIPDYITSRNDFQECVKFHGHTCMGLTIGYLAAKLAIELLEVDRAVDEELIAVVENDACCCDAVQVLTGCTFGKGNFFFKDYGKMAFSFGSRSTGKSIRLVLKPDVLNPPEDEIKLRALIQSGHASPEDMSRYEAISEKRLRAIFSDGPRNFFIIQERAEPFPPHAVIAQSIACDRCGEMVMETKMEKLHGRNLCRTCAPQEL